VSPDERVRRLVDGELDAAAEAALRADAERDPALGRALADAEVVARALESIEVPEPPVDLVDQAVLRAVRHKARLEIEMPRWKRWLRSARVTPLAAAVAAAAAALIALSVAREPSPTAPTLAQASPAPVEEARVRLVLPLEGARTVAVAGDFNDWRTDDVFLEDPEGDGVFVGTLRLPPGSYAYMFVVDGERWVTDPYAVNHRDDGFGNRNAVLRVD
jgi:hypothetical protein